jgi:hypothetical protein
MNIKTFVENSNALSSEAARIASDFDAVSLAIKDYVQRESTQNLMLLNRINACNTVFETLEGIASAMLKNARTLNEKIISSCAAFEVVANAEAMLKDIRETFPVIVSNDSAEKEKQIRQILDNLNKISYQCTHFQTFPKPYKDIIDLYNVKIESVFHELLKQPDKIAAKNIETPMAAISDNTKITRLISDIEHLTQERDQSNAENRKIKENLEGTKGGLAAAIVFGVLGILFAISIGNGKYSSMESRYRSAIYDKNQLQMEYDTLSNNDALQTKYDTLSKDNDTLQTNYDALSDYVASSNLLPIKITAIEVGNWNNGWVNRPRETLIKANVYFLRPEISYQALANANIKLDIKWFFPNNDLPSRWEESAPRGYTYTENINVSTQFGTSTLRQWGWYEPGRFPSGTHRIEIWWNGIMLSSTTVTLN